jgi:energy-coupling factor transport system ATP-binding protein
VQRWTRPLLELEGVGYHPAAAERPILDAVNLCLEPGQAALVVGRSGSGKTTLLELIAGLATPDGGQIRWDGQVLSSRERRWLCGLVFQFPERHFIGLTVAQELKLGHRRLDSERMEQVMATVGLAGVSLQQAPERLSGGQQRRLALAVQLLRDPKVLLLDEPSAGLDWSVRQELVGLVGRLAAERLVLIVTHEPEVFAAVAAKRWQLQQGVCSPLP